MPFYDYLCNDCGLVFEISKNVTKFDQVEECINCKSKNTKIQIGRTGFQFSESYPSKSLDLAVGKSAEERWKAIEERNSIKTKGIKEQSIDFKAGTKEHRAKRDELVSDYKGALQTHRKERESKGIGQFDGTPFDVKK